MEVSADEVLRFVVYTRVSSDPLYITVTDLPGTRQHQTPPRTVKVGKLKSKICSRLGLHPDSWKYFSVFELPGVFVDSPGIAGMDPLRALEADELLSYPSKNLALLRWYFSPQSITGELATDPAACALYQKQIEDEIDADKIRPPRWVIEELERVDTEGAEGQLRYVGMCEAFGDFPTVMVDTAKLAHTFTVSAGEGTEGTRRVFKQGTNLTIYISPTSGLHMEDRGGSWRRGAHTFPLRSVRHVMLAGAWLGECWAGFDIDQLDGDDWLYVNTEQAKYLVQGTLRIIGMMAPGVVGATGMDGLLVENPPKHATKWRNPLYDQTTREKPINNM